MRMRHSQALYETVALLADREVAARAGAVEALGDSGSQAAELLLRLKVLSGDEEDIIAACFQSLLAASLEKSVPFVANYLAGGAEARVESAG